MSERGGMDDSEIDYDHGYEIPGVHCGGAIRPPTSRCCWCLILPHSGSLYPEDFTGFSCPLPVLRRAEDAYVDELFGARRPIAARLLIAAVFPRSYLDVNRAADDLDPGLLAAAWPKGLALRPVTSCRPWCGASRNRACRSMTASCTPMR